MKKILFFIFMIFSFSNLLANQWDGFFKETGFPKKVIDDGSIVKGKLYQAKITYQISNNDGIKGNFENNDTAKVTVTNSKGKVISTNKFMTAAELRTWGRVNFLEILSSILGDEELSKEKITELTKLASIALLNKNID
ncbi:hypothetical protein [Arcobacter cloacae]|uniref:Uncharacterized protein n=1 Tax=Arcobacter cloacae TaxID=1054034 RepID=A0A6M8NRD5_9BACT|nr:hypothetical protein [Arcobacter cloacae]QKF90324.1 hypothetical protein ACLO_1841 [Arcobacter cloacae]RXI41883.1 hypothetical protein CP963_04790 [Arcobacter cloacae]